VYGVAITKLIEKVKSLEQTVKSSKARRKAKFVISDDEEEDSFNQGRQDDISLHDLEPNFEFTAHKEVYTAEPNITTANVPVSTASAEVSTAIPEVSTAAKSLVYIRRSAAKRKDKEALRLEEQLDEEERQRIARAHEEALAFNIEEWDDIQAQIDPDEEF
ncbi:hypothetical protein Tco_0248617, partial [Tanacetum coccineum]